MKMLKINLMISLMFLLNVSLSYSQKDSTNFYYPDDISIEYAKGYMSVLNSKGKKIIQKPYFESIDNINKLIFSNDSMITVSGEDLSQAQININKINKVSMSGGSRLWTGVGLGALAGLGIGIAIGAANDFQGKYGGLITAFGGLIGVLSGGLIGGLVGSQISGTEDYELRENKNKKAELERILNIDKKLNANNVSY